jgi:hypothetical protein
MTSPGNLQLHFGVLDLAYTGDAEYGQDGAAPFDQIGFGARIRENEIVEET